MLPINCGSHADYQNFVTKNLRKYYPDPASIARSTWDIIERFWILDLSFTDEFMKNKYSVFGPEPRTPSCMQRSYLLSIDFKVSSVTDWAAQLKINPLYAILSGFEFGDTPGVGTVFDTVTTVKRVIRFVVSYPALVGLLCLAVFFKDVKHLIGNVNISIYAYVGIVIFQVNSFHGCTMLSILGLLKSKGQLWRTTARVNGRKNARQSKAPSG